MNMLFFFTRKMPSLVFHLIQEQGGQPGSLDDCETDPAHPTPHPPATRGGHFTWDRSKLLICWAIEVLEFLPRHNLDGLSNTVVAVGT